MQNELSSLDPSDVNYKQNVQGIIVKYCDYFNNHESRNNKASNALSSLEEWINRSYRNKADWIRDGRELLADMNKNRDYYPPQIQALVEQYANEIVIGTKSIIEARFSNKREEELKTSEEHLRNFYSKLRTIIYPPETLTSEVVDANDMPVFRNPLFQALADGKKLNWGKAMGDKEVMTNEDWQEYAKLLIYLEKNGRLEYSKTTSGKIEKGVFKTDCWGILKIGSQLTLNEEGMRGQSFRKISYMVDDFMEKGSLTEVKRKDFLDVNQLISNPNTFVFIDNNDKKSGYDHVYIVVENLEDKDTGEIYPIGLLGISGSGIGLQTYDANKWYESNSGKPIAFGTQYKQEK